MNSEPDNIQPILDRIAEIVWREMEENYRLFLFGSRASDGHDSKADIDIGIIADKPVEAKTMVSIKEKLEQIPTLLKIDFVDFSSVSHDFRKIAMKKTKETVFSIVIVMLAFGSAAWAAETGEININTASAEELAQLKRIGPKYAARIIESRETNGPFKMPEDIMKVKGIGQKTWEEN